MTTLVNAKARLIELNKSLTEEEACSDRSQFYIDDLKLSIKECEAQIAQLTFAKANPDPLLINGAVLD